MKQTHQPKRQTTQSNNHRHAGPRAHLRSLHRCSALPDGISGSVHQSEIEQATVSRPERDADALKRGGLTTLLGRRIIIGPRIIRADGMWRITYRDGITERFAATRHFAPRRSENITWPAECDESRALAA